MRLVSYSWAMIGWGAASWVMIGWVASWVMIGWGAASWAMIGWVASWVMIGGGAASWVMIGWGAASWAMIGWGAASWAMIGWGAASWAMIGRGCNKRSSTRLNSWNSNDALKNSPCSWKIIYVVCRIISLELKTIFWLTVNLSFTIQNKQRNTISVFLGNY